MADVREVPVAGRELSPRAGLRVRPQRPVRAVFGALLVVASVVVALTIFTKIGDRREVLAVNRTILAGEQLADGDFRVVSISSDDDFPSVPAGDRELLVGQYARVRMHEGSLVVADSVQARPLVDPDAVLMSVTVPVGGVPRGLREGSRLVLIVMPAARGGDRPEPVLVEAIVAAVPSNLGEIVGSSGDSGVSSVVALSVEVPPDRAALVGSAEKVAVGVLDPKAEFPSGAATAGEGPSG
jgi:hypothetical protein